MDDVHYTTSKAIGEYLLGFLCPLFRIKINGLAIVEMNHKNYFYELAAARERLWFSGRKMFK